MKKLNIIILMLLVLLLFACTREGDTELTSTPKSEDSEYFSSSESALDELTDAFVSREETTLSPEVPSPGTFGNDETTLSPEITTPKETAERLTTEEITTVKPDVTTPKETTSKPIVTTPQVTTSKPAITTPQEMTEKPAPPQEPEKEIISLPKPYIDIDFTSDGKINDKYGSVLCELTSPQKGSVVTSIVRINGKEYTLPHLYVKDKGGEARLTYKNISSYAELLSLLEEGFTLEMLAVNENDFTASSAEQCLAASTQGGGYNFTVYKGRYAFSVYTGSGYNTVSLPFDHDRVNMTHFLGVYDPNTKKAVFYINGEKAASLDALGALKLAGGEGWMNIMLGGDTNANRGTELHSSNTRIADYKLYTDIMSESQAKDAYRAAFASITGENADFEIKYYTKDEIYGERLFASYDESYADVYEPSSSLVNSPTVIGFASSASLALEEGGKRPATLIFNLKLKDGELYACTKDGKEISSLYSALDRIKGRIIPAFSVNEKNIAEALCSFINYNRIGDCFIISESEEILIYIRENTRSARPILDMSECSDKSVSEISLAVSSAKAKSVILSSSCVTQEKVKALRAYALSVFLVSDKDEKAYIHDAIFKGGMGIILSDTSLALDYIESVKEETLCFPTMIVAHRGDMQNLPQNVMRSFISAAKSGADVIELDTYLTKDGHIAINHDKQTTHWDKKLICTESTREELKALVCTESKATDEDKFTFLDEVFDYFSKNYTHVYFTVEVKDYREALIDKIIELADAYGIRDRMIIICMGSNIVSYTYKTYGVAVQKNISTLADKNDLKASLVLACEEATAFNSSFFTQWKDAVYELNRMLRHRGIKYSPWTTSTETATDADFAKGYPEFTTNTPHRVDSYARYLRVEQHDDRSVTVTRVNYDGSVSVVTEDAEFIPLSGDVSYKDGKICGNGRYAFALKTSLANKYTYRIVSLSCEG